MNPAEIEPLLREDSDMAAYVKITIRRLDKIETVVCSNSSGN